MRKLLFSAGFLGCIAFGCGAAFAASPLVERVDTTGFIQVESPSFNSLTLQQKALAYWLSQAAIAADPIAYDQLSRFGLEQRRVLEAVVSAKAKVEPALYAKIADFTKLFWANRGNHDQLTAQKVMPGFTPEELRRALEQAGHIELVPKVDALRQSLFDAAFEPMLTAKNPAGGKDIIQASANNFYSGVTLAELKDFPERYRLNSTVVKQNGRIVEQVWRTGTPDGKVPPGLYADYLRRTVEYLGKARGYASPAQAKVIDDLIRYYQTGEFKDWLQFGADWVRNNEPVDLVNGFVEVYRDARGAKATMRSFVSVTDAKLTEAMRKLADNAQYFEERAPWDARYKKQGIQAPVVKAVETVIEAGDLHVTTIGENLPNEKEIQEKYGSKSFLLTGSSRALAEVQGGAMSEEFAASPQEVALAAKYGRDASELLTAMHEVIGHGSGKLNPKLTEDAAFYLKEYWSTLEEARADLMAMWNVFDPKLKELGLVASDDVGRQMYNDQARVMLMQLRRIPSGETIEEDHQRDRQMIVRYIMDKTGAIALEQRSGKSYVVVKDYKKMREGVGMLLAELMRIKAEGDYNAIRALVEKYGVHFDPKLRDEVVQRYKALNLPTYWAGINADLTAQFDGAGKVTRVDISYPRDYMKQQLAYSSMYPPK